MYVINYNIMFEGGGVLTARCLASYVMHHSIDELHRKSLRRSRHGGTRKRRTLILSTTIDRCSYILSRIIFYLSDRRNEY